MISAIKCTTFNAQEIGLLFLSLSRVLCVMQYKVSYERKKHSRTMAHSVTCRLGAAKVYCGCHG